LFLIHQIFLHKNFKHLFTIIIEELGKNSIEYRIDIGIEMLQNQKVLNQTELTTSTSYNPKFLETDQLRHFQAFMLFLKVYPCYNYIIKLV
jgi:hypothetical protein